MNLCPLCHQTTQQSKILIFGLKNKLGKLYGTYSPVYKQNSMKEQKKNQSFKQLIKIVFSVKQFAKMVSTTCPHHKIFRYLKRKLKCDSQAFAAVCEQLCMLLVQKNYQLQIVSNQISLISQRAEVSYETGKFLKSTSQLKSQKTIQISSKSCNPQVENVKQAIKTEIKVQTKQYNQQKQKQIAQPSVIIQTIPQQFNYTFPYGFFYPYRFQ